LIRRELFARIGQFDAGFFMYADEYDLSWRVWIAGSRAVAVPAARLHHRGAVNVNPKGAGTVVETRTSDSKRYYTNRNNLLVILKNTQHVLLLLVPLQIGFLMLEAVAGIVLIRRWSFLRRAYLEAFADCWRQRDYWRAERSKIRALRRRSDWWMMRFLRLRLNRWDELRNIGRFGLPKVNKE